MASQFLREMEKINKKSAKEAVESISENRDYEKIDLVEESLSPVKEEKGNTDTPIEKNVVNEALTQNFDVKEKKKEINKEIPVKAGGYFPKKALLLTNENMRQVRIHSRKSGVSVENFLNYIVECEREKTGTEEDEERSLQIYKICSSNFKEKKNRTTVGFSEENAKYITDETNNAGVTFVSYMNYLIDKFK